VLQLAGAVHCLLEEEEKKTQRRVVQCTFTHPCFGFSNTWFRLE